MRALLLFSATLWLTGCVSLTPYEQVVAEVPPENLVTLDDQQVYFEDRGSGEVILLIHGFGSSAYSWREVITELERDFRVIAVDLSGFGFTERPREMTAYTRYAQGELILKLLDELGIEKAHLVGHSYGGAVGAALAVRSPERIETLTLLNAAGPVYTQMRRSRFASFRPASYTLVRTKLRLKNIERALKRSLANDEFATKELVHEYQRRLAIEGAVRAFRGLTAPMPDPQAVVELSELELPTLALWGAEDILIPAEVARKETSTIAASRFVLIEGAGHVPMEERPVEVARRIKQFLEHGLETFDRSEAARGAPPVAR